MEKMTINQIIEKIDELWNNSKLISFNTENPILESKKNYRILKIEYYDTYNKIIKEQTDIYNLSLQDYKEYRRLLKDKLGIGNGKI